MEQKSDYSSVYFNISDYTFLYSEILYFDNNKLNIHMKNKDVLNLSDVQSYIDIKEGKYKYDLLKSPEIKLNMDDIVDNFTNKIEKRLLIIVSEKLNKLDKYSEKLKNITNKINTINDDINNLKLKELKKNIDDLKWLTE